jgi:small conductance mechanosensitive channel
MKNAEWIDWISRLAIDYGLKVIIAIVVLIIGFKLIAYLMRIIERIMVKRGLDKTIQAFLSSLTSIALKILLIISVLAIVGVETTSFAALLAAAGLAVGMALSGTLQNFAGGVMISLFKPFVIGDLIEAEGFLGIVKEIQIFNTILLTLDNRTIIIPNAQLSSNALINYSKEPLRRVDMTFGIGYQDDIDHAKKVLWALIGDDDRVLKDPAAFVAVGELADSSVNFSVRLWVKAEDYWGVYFDFMENVKKAFDKENISIPYPQTDVHLFQEK